MIATVVTNAQDMFTSLMTELAPTEVTKLLDTSGANLLGALADLHTTLQATVVGCGVQDLSVPLGGKA